MNPAAIKVAHREVITVHAQWDDEAGVWVATSDDIQGLAIEGETLEQLKDKVAGAVEDLIERNGLAYDATDIPIQITTEATTQAANPIRN